MCEELAEAYPWEGEAPAEPHIIFGTRLGRSLALPKDLLQSFSRMFLEHLAYRFSTLVIPAQAGIHESA